MYANPQGWKKRRAKARARRMKRQEQRMAATPIFNLAGNWMQQRAKVRDVLGLDGVPKSKDEARALLMDAGYRVEG